jgi:hypothetical protein
MKSYDNRDLAALLVKFKDHLTCWKVGLSLGSLLYFEMGKQWPATLENGSVVEVGSTTLVLESDDWTITWRGNRIADSDSITDDLVDNLIWKYFINKRLRSIVWQNESNECVIYFDGDDDSPNDTIIHLKGESDEDLCTITAPDGTIISCNPKSGFISDGSRSEPHVTAYASEEGRGEEIAPAPLTQESESPTTSRVQFGTAALGTAGAMHADVTKIATEIATRSMCAWNSVYIFRWMGTLGLPHAKKQAAWQHKRTVRHIAEAEEYRELFTGDPQKLLHSGFFESVTKGMIAQSVTAFESVLDAASLVFAHSVLDGAAFDWCKVCARAGPEDLMQYVAKKTFSLAEISAAANYEELRDDAIAKYVDDLGKESLLKKLDILFALCRPPRGFVGIEKYHYDRERIRRLDNLRHDYVHRGTLGVRLPRGDDDIWYLWKTTNFLLPLVSQRYSIRIDPNQFIGSLGIATAGTRTIR